MQCDEASGCYAHPNCCPHALSNSTTRVGGPNNSQANCEIAAKDPVQATKKKKPPQDFHLAAAPSFTFQT